MSAPVALRLDGLCAGYDGIPVVHDLDLEVAAGEVLALLGANGSGKTTTLLTVSGLLPRVAGRIEVLGTEVPARRTARLRRVWSLARQGVAHVPEDRGLFFDLTARENLLLGHRGRRAPVELAQLLGWFPALARILGRRAGLLSGGEQQMLALARAVVSGPRLLLVDELSLGLAPVIVEQLLPVLRAIANETGMAVVVVEQHVGLALATADRAVVLRRGRVLASGPAAELARHADLLQAGYLGSDDRP